MELNAGGTFSLGFGMGGGRVDAGEGGGGRRVSVGFWKRCSSGRLGRFSTGCFAGAFSIGWGGGGGMGVGGGGFALDFGHD
jgi:hypothetical protein